MKYRPFAVALFLWCGITAAGQARMPAAAARKAREEASARAQARPDARVGLPHISPKARHDYTAVLMWHDVVADKKQVWFDTTVAEFKAQLEAIRRRHFHVITLDQLYHHLTEGAPVPSRPLVLTFDDNYQGTYNYAFPLLKQYRYPAVMFAHTAYVGVSTDKEHCTWDQLREMEASGLVTVQSHTRSHPDDLRTLSEEHVRGELAGSKTTLEQQLRHPVYALTYPNGKYDDRVAGIAAQVGYKLAFMEDWGSAESSRNLLLVHRYSIHKRFAQALNDVERAYAGRP